MFALIIVFINIVQSRQYVRRSYCVALLIGHKPGVACPSLDLSVLYELLT